MKRLIKTAFFYLILGIAGGVFYREFTKFNGFEGRTTLAFLHVHMLVLGMIFFLIVFLMDKSLNLAEHKMFNRFYLIYNLGLLTTFVTLLARGIMQVWNIQVFSAGIAGIAGLGHIFLGIGLVLFFVMVFKKIGNENTKKIDE